MKILKDETSFMRDNVPALDVDVTAVVSPTYKKALEDREAIRARIKKQLKDKEARKEPILGTKSDKLTLGESLFEDLDEDRHEELREEKICESHNCKDENKAKDLVKRYHNYEFDLGDLHKQLRRLFDTNKDAVEWLYDYEHGVSESLKESKKLNEGAGAGYTIEGKLSDIFVKSVYDIRKDKNGFVLCNCEGSAVLSDISASSYMYGNDVGGKYDVAITSLTIDADGLGDKYTDEDALKDFINDEALNSTVRIKGSVGGGWSHEEFTGEFNARVSDSSNYTDFDGFTIRIDNERVIKAIDDAVTGEDWVEEYLVYDEDDDVLEYFETEEEAVDFAKKNRGVRVTKRNVQYTLLSDGESVDASYDGTEEDVWEREYTRYYKYDESLEESHENNLSEEAEKEVKDEVEVKKEKKTRGKGQNLWTKVYEEIFLSENQKKSIPVKNGHKLVDHISHYFDPAKKGVNLGDDVGIGVIGPENIGRLEDVANAFKLKVRYSKNGRNAFVVLPDEFWDKPYDKYLEAKGITL